GAGLLFHGQDVLLRAGGIEQNADGEREFFLLGEVLDGLGNFVLGDRAVGLGEVGYEAVLVARGEEDVDEVDVDVDGGGVDVGDRLGGRVALWRRGADGGCLLRGERAQSERQNECGRECGSEEAKAHGVIHIKRRICWIVVSPQMFSWAATKGVVLPSNGWTRSRGQWMTRLTPRW